MKTYLVAAAFAVAMPAVAHAAEKPATPAQGQAPAKAHECCCKDMMARHADHAGKMQGHDMSGHHGHDMSQHQQHQQPPK